ncbi:NADH-quinone oxidoreductase subunit NuoK [Catenulispora rubra]|uniref:NADH-quinone oxidoreductase subunit NuoK n=1 Tax=Catenulispora rubra TaxID=280293 RepID=UPI0018923444
MHAIYPLTLAALLFAVGVYGLLARRNAVAVLMAIELLLNAVNLNLVTFSSLLRDQYGMGQVFTVFLITVAAAETGLGLAIVLLLYRNRGTAAIDDARELGEDGSFGLKRVPPQADGDGTDANGSNADNTTEAAARTPKAVTK